MQGKNSKISKQKKNSGYFMKATQEEGKYKNNA